jgi:hypothetical protein
VGPGFQAGSYEQRSRTFSAGLVLPESSVSSAGGGSGAVGHLQFEQQRGDVVAHSLFGQAEAAGDLVVAGAGGEQIEHVAFAGG